MKWTGGARDQLKKKQGGRGRFHGSRRATSSSNDIFFSSAATAAVAAPPTSNLPTTTRLVDSKRKRPHVVNGSLASLSEWSAAAGLTPGAVRPTTTLNKTLPIIISHDLSKPHSSSSSSSSMEKFVTATIIPPETQFIAPRKVFEKSDASLDAKRTISKRWDNIASTSTSIMFDSIITSSQEEPVSQHPTPSLVSESNDAKNSGTLKSPRVTLSPGHEPFFERVEATIPKTRSGNVHTTPVLFWNEGRMVRYVEKKKL